MPTARSVTSFTTHTELGRSEAIVAVGLNGPGGMAFEALDNARDGIAGSIHVARCQVERIRRGDDHSRVEVDQKTTFSSARWLMQVGYSGPSPAAARLIP